MGAQAYELRGGGRLGERRVMAHAAALLMLAATGPSELAWMSRRELAMQARADGPGLLCLR